MTLGATLELLPIRLCRRELFLERGSARGILFIRDLLLQGVDLRRERGLRRFIRFTMENVKREDRVAHILVRDYLDVGREHRIPVSVVIVKMGVDHVPDRLIGEHFHVLQEGACRGRSGAIVDQHHVVVVHDYDVVAAEAAGGVVDSLGDLFELVRLTLNDGVFRRTNDRTEDR